MDIIGAHLSSGAALLLWILAAILVIAGFLSTPASVVYET